MQLLSSGAKDVAGQRKKVCVRAASRPHRPLSPVASPGEGPSNLIRLHELKQ